MASARYGYMTVSPSDRATLKRPHSELLTAPGTSAGTPPQRRPQTDATPASTAAITKEDNFEQGEGVDGSEHEIYKSAPIHDRKSTFVGYFSPTMPPLDLQSLPEISSSQHRILAYRIGATAPLSSTPERGAKRTKVTQSRLPFKSGADGRTLSGKPGHAGAGAGEAKEAALQTGQDDDGETYGAKSVMSVLARHGDAVRGSVVVARWYGGVLLGPVRFRHMERAAGEAIEAWRASSRTQPAGTTPAAAETQAETQAQEKGRLALELGERDASIASLRALLAGKKVVLAGFEGRATNSGGGGEPSTTTGAAPGAATEVSPGKKLDYSAMPLERLRLLDKARDNTVAFLLKQIDAVEAQVESWTALMDAAGADDDDEDDGDGVDGAVDGAGEKEGGTVRNKILPTPVGTRSSAA